MHGGGGMMWECNGADERGGVYMFQMRTPEGTVTCDSLGSVEQQVRELLPTLDLDSLTDLLVGEVKRRKMETLPLYAHVLRNLYSLQHYQVLYRIQQEADSEVEKLKACYQTDCWEWYRRPGWDTILEAGEYPAWPKAALMRRVLVPLRLALRVFEAADVNQFRHHGVALYTIPEKCQPEKIARVRVSRRNGCLRVDWDWFETRVLKVKAVEFGMDYTKEWGRWMVGRPDAVFEAGVVLSTWANVLRTTKMSQMQSENRSDWPEMRPWDIHDLSDMIVGLWLEMQSDDDKL